MRSARTVLTLALVLVMATALAAAPKKGKGKKGKKAPPCPAAQRVDRMLSGVELTDEQKTKLGEIKKEFGPKLMEVMKKMDVLTPEQKKARAAAAKEAKAAGKKGKEAREAIDAAVKMTEEQKDKIAEVRKEMRPLEKELREQVLAVLTDEQKQQVKKPHGGKKKAPK